MQFRVRNRSDRARKEHRDQKWGIREAWRARGIPSPGRRGQPGFAKPGLVPSLTLLEAYPRLMPQRLFHRSLPEHGGAGHKVESAQRGGTLSLEAPRKIAPCQV